MPQMPQESIIVPAPITPTKGIPGVKLVTPSEVIVLANLKREYISDIGYTHSVSSFIDTGIPAILGLPYLIYKLIDSYIVPREAIPGHADYAMPPYKGDEARFLDPVKEAIHQYQKNRKPTEYKSNFIDFLKDLEKANKYAEKHLSKELRDLRKELKKYTPKQNWDKDVYKGLMG